MPSLKPWYRVISPREDLRQGKPLDASKFAIHLDQVRDGRAAADYQKYERCPHQGGIGSAAEIVSTQHWRKHAAPCYSARYKIRPQLLHRMNSPCTRSL
jgi:hypothetical protein